ncbi:hypothetical protein N7G274_002619 [Stereocaulon virgatum]|uniref:non-specific serine/threonine protein kinase n=1 Tax=Stereocaulon virgatum TaxID=373712 RepID=A0ABR4AH52_9LECA
MAHEVTNNFNQLPEHPDEDGPQRDSAPVSPGILFSESGSPPSFSPMELDDPFECLQSSSSISSVLDRPALPPRSTTLSQGKLSKLADFFTTANGPRTRYSDADIHGISRCLKDLQRHAESEVPRLYAVLRMIGQLQILDAMLEVGISDVWFPFSAAQVPKVLSPSLRAKFLEVQALVLTKGVDLEKNGTTMHAHFGREDTFPFEVRETLGAGSYATVDKLFSPFSRREFARKRFRRSKGESKAEIESFKNELQVLKKINHHHCVELVASYSDFKYFGLIMSPVADCNLASFYNLVPDDPRYLDTLRTFYGCLAKGLQYVHSSEVRHRDIKPENILVKNECIYLADFGIALDWESLGRGTTTEDTGKSWIYCAPEVANYKPRNQSSDIWSLGCVFLEMTTVLKGRTVAIMRQHFQSANDSHKFHECLPAITSWSQNLRNLGKEYDNFLLEWTAGMMQSDSRSRPSADDLCAGIANFTCITNDEVHYFCRDCRADGDDTVSSVGNNSNDDIWSDNRDVGLVSPCTSAPSTDKSTKSLDAKSCLDVYVNPIAHDVSDDSTPAIQIAVREPMGESNGPAAELEQLPTTTSSLTPNTSLPNHPFLRKPSREVVRSRDSHSDLPMRGATPRTMDAESAKQPTAGARASCESRAEQGVEVEEHTQRVSTGKDFPRGTDAALDLRGRLQKPGTGRTLASPNKLAAEMTAALEASRSRRPSPALVPEEGLRHMLTVESSSRPDDRRVSSDMQNLRGWQTIGFRNNLPKLGPLSWTKPSHLLDDIKSDMSFMTFLATNYDDCYDLVSAATLQDVTALVEMLLRNGFQLDAWTYVDAEGISPIFSVLDWGEEYRTLFNLMVNSGANLDYESRDGSNLLSRAAMYGYTWALEILVNAGAKLNRKKRHTAIVDAAYSNQLETIQYLVHTLRAAPDLKTTEGTTALRVASLMNHIGICKFLLETCRDDIDVENRVDEQSILYDACVGNRTQIVELLLAHGADPNAAGGVLSGKWTPLQKASKAGSMDIVRALVTYGADISARSLPIVHGAGARGTTAVVEARKGGYMDVVTYLESEIEVQARETRLKSSKKKSKKAALKDSEEGFSDTEMARALADVQHTLSKVRGLKKGKKIRSQDDNLTDC